MTNENGIEILCSNCKHTCILNRNTKKCKFAPTESAFRRRIQELSEICDMQSLLIDELQKKWSQGNKKRERAKNFALSFFWALGIRISN